ncbi:energy-coupling factor transporter transmembrane component T [Thermosynechococcaceae cyanobacterium Okahandja]
MISSVPSSPFYRWSPPARVVALLTLMLGISGLQTMGGLGVASISVLMCGIASQVSWRRVGDRLRHARLVLIGLWLFLPFGGNGTPPLGWLSATGVQTACLLSWRFILCLVLAVILLETLTFSQWLAVCRWCYLPPLLTDTLALTYRYLFELKFLLAQMQQALFLRGFRLHWRRLRPWAQLIGTFLIRTEERAQQIYLAMRLRGYGLAKQQRPTFPDTAPWSWALTSLVILGVGILIAWDSGWLLS